MTLKWALLGLAVVIFVAVKCVLPEKKVKHFWWLLLLSVVVYTIGARLSGSYWP